jgi:hypothetical protein
MSWSDLAFLWVVLIPAAIVIRIVVSALTDD